jgi:hypothetical protein
LRVVFFGADGDFGNFAEALFGDSGDGAWDSFISFELNGLSFRLLGRVGVDPLLLFPKSSVSQAPALFFRDFYAATAARTLRRRRRSVATQPSKRRDLTLSVSPEI